MRTNGTWVLTAVAGFVLGAGITQVIRAQAQKTAPAYLIAEVAPDPAKTADRAAARRYAEEAPKSLVPFNGQYVVRGGTVETLEGEPPKGYIVVIGFDSMEKARAWYSSAAYQAVKPIRQRSTKSRLLLVEGVPPS
ncbi:MAG: DUF1330 domain-containing protein [Terriglobales bacterium]